MGQKWSKEKAWEWFNSRPWIRGFNYISCGAVNRIEQWQEFEHDRIEECFRTELKLAHDTGFNAVRSILPYEVWGRQHDSFMKYLETYLEICAENGLGVMLCFGNDCTVPTETYKLPEFGPQHVDYGYHGGMARSPTASRPLMCPNTPRTSAVWWTKSWANTQRMSASSSGTFSTKSATAAAAC